jgi:hypothetical protein
MKNEEYNRKWPTNNHILWSQVTLGENPRQNILGAAGQVDNLWGDFQKCHWGNP